jgi:hypothetical protein
MGKTNNDLAVIISANTDPLVSDLKRASQQLIDFNKLAKKSSAGIEIKQESGRQSASVRALTREADAHRNAMRAMSSDGSASFGKLTAASLTAGVALKAFASAGDAIGAFFDQAKGAVQMAADFERTSISFEVMLGSGERAAAMLGDLRKFAAETPFGSKETTDAARQLLAFGTAADQIIPTLRMLGNISAPIADTTSLKDLTYLYGTLAAQQRAFTVDLNQFANRGIPIYEELAKVMKIDTDEVRKFAEEGRVGFVQVARALENLQSKGGRFHGMLEAQANSLHGLWEQASDAWSQAKLELGKIIVQEAGLKDVVKDLEALGKGLANNTATSQGLRDTVRFVADVVKGTAQVGYELGKGAALSADIFGQMAKDVPIFKETFGSIQNVIQGMKDFRINPSDMATVAVNVSKDILSNAAALALLVAESGKSFKENILDPIVDTIKELKAFRQGVKDFRVMIPMPVGPPVPLPKHAELRDAADWMSKFDPRREFDLLTRPHMRPFYEQMDRQREKNNPAAEVKRDDPFASLRDAGKKLKDTFDLIGKSGDDLIYHLKAREADAKAQKLAAERIAQMNAHQKGLADFRQIWGAWTQNGLGHIGTNPIALMNSLPLAAYGMKMEQERVNTFAALGGGPMALARGGATEDPDKFRLRLQDSFPHLKSLAKQLNEDFNPMLKLNRELAELQQMLDLDLIKQPVFEFERRKKVEAVADHLGLGPTQLPGAALVGSAEDARLINMWKTGAGNTTTEDLLKQIRDLLARMEKSVDRIEQAPMPRPVEINAS